MTELDPDQIPVEEITEVADPDTEDKLNQLIAMQVRRRKDPDLERRYEALRGDLTKQLAREGARWFETDDGSKLLAVTISPEKTDLDVEEAIRLYEEGELDLATLDMIAPRGQSLEGIRTAITKGWLTPAQMRKVLTFRPGTPYVKFVDPLGRDSQ